MDVVPMQTLGVPVIAPGEVMTVAVCVTLHVPPSEYVMIAVPTVIPVNVPVPEPTVATVALLLVQVPPLIPSLRVTLVPSHRPTNPPITEGEGETVIVVVAKHPVDTM
jgi:hypothetical protein